MKFIRDIISEKRAQATGTPRAMPERELPAEFMQHDDVRSDVEIDDEGFVLPPHPVAEAGEYDDDGLADAGMGTDADSELTDILNPPDDFADDDDDLVSFDDDAPGGFDRDSFTFASDEPLAVSSELDAGADDGVDDGADAEEMAEQTAMTDDAEAEADAMPETGDDYRDVAEDAGDIPALAAEPEQEPAEPEEVQASEENIFSTVSEVVADAGRDADADADVMRDADIAADAGDEDMAADEDIAADEDAEDEGAVAAGWTGAMPRRDIAVETPAAEAAPVGEMPSAPEPAEAPVEAPAAAAAAAQPVNVPAPAAGRASRRAGRVKTRLLGFNGAQSRGADPFAVVSEEPTVEHTQFPVGWLVVVKGPGRGSAFTLFDGVAQIGRGAGQTVRLDFGDNSISRENHAAIAYDAEQREFYLGHGGKANLVRLNDRPVLSTEQLTADDLIRIGETTLKFVALCGSDFDWNEAREGQLKHASYA